MEDLLQEEGERSPYSQYIFKLSLSQYQYLLVGQFVTFS